MQPYFFIAVSIKENLELCKKYAHAGLPSTINGLWAYLEIREGDYVSFLYGAKAHNLYKVLRKEAIEGSAFSYPWEPLSRRGKAVGFQYRLYLKPVRKFDESLAREGFQYIAENLMLRGGYRKTHFQADQTTLQSASQLPEVYSGEPERLSLPPHNNFIPKFVRGTKTKQQGVFQLREIILHSLIRQHLSKSNKLDNFFGILGFKGFAPEDFEILTEKALPRGYVDLLIKDSKPMGRSRIIAVEVKLSRAGRKDVEQLQRYVEELGEECVVGVIIAEEIPKRISSPDVRFMKYEFGGIDLKEPRAFEELLSAIQISSE